MGCDWEGRWNYVRKFLERPGPFTHPDFEPGPEVMHQSCHCTFVFKNSTCMHMDLYTLRDVCDVSPLSVSTIPLGNMSNSGHWRWRTWM